MRARLKQLIIKSPILHVVLPVGLTVILFISAIFILTLPAFEASLMESKKETIKELTRVGWEILSRFENRVQLGEITRQQAQEEAIACIRELRYGPEQKDYFWINDLSPKMVMHPYRLDLKGSDLTNFRDSKGNRIFIDFLKAVEKDGEGYSQYLWQWKDNPNRIVPKLSYVKTFVPWGWVIGTGIYIEDVQARIHELSRNLKTVFSVILFFILLLSYYIIWQTRQNEKKKYDAEAALKKSEECYRTILKIFQDGYFEVDLSGNMVFCNDAMTKIVGYPKEELLGMNNRRYMDGETAFKVFQTFNEVYKTGKPYKGIDWKLNRPDGKTIWIETSVTLIHDADDKAIGFRGVVRDITERKITEETIQEAKNRYQAIVEDMPAMICRLRPDYTLTFANANYGRQFQAAPKELIGKKLYELLSEEEWRKVKNHYQSLSIENPMKTDIHRTVSKNGTEKWQEWTDRALFNHQGELIEYQSLGRDITEQKQAAEEKESLEKQLRHAQKMESIGTLTGGIAHDFNNILSIILGNTEIALDDLTEWNPSRRNLSEIRNATLRAKEVIQQLLSFSRKGEHQLKPVRIEDVIRDTLKLLRASIPSNVTINQNIRHPIGIIMADPTQIHQIVLNLCTNAFHAVEHRGGKMDIELSNIHLDESQLKSHPGLFAGDYVNLTISDNGEGISEDIIDKIFDPYFTTKEIGKGTGMGLSVVHGIVKNHGGDIQVESQTDQGTCFRLYFPIVDVEYTESPKPSQPLPNGSETILFVDDEELIVQITEVQLQKLGYRVEAETDPVEALDRFRSSPEQFDLVITDMTMPQLSGENLVKELLNLRPGLPVIICTGYNDKITESVSGRIGAKGLLMKPFGIHELAVMIRQVLDSSSGK